MLEYEVLKERIDDTSDEMKLLRKRIHVVENNGASHMGMTREIQANANWIIKKLDEMMEIKDRINDKIASMADKINNINFEMVSIKNKNLQEKIEEKTNNLNKLKSFLFSAKFISVVGWTLFLCMYYADKFSFAGHVDNARKIING